MHFYAKRVDPEVHPWNSMLVPDTQVTQTKTSGGWVGKEMASQIAQMMELRMEELLFYVKVTGY